MVSSTKSQVSDDKLDYLLSSLACPTVLLTILHTVTDNNVLENGHFLPGLLTVLITVPLCN